MTHRTRVTLTFVVSSEELPGVPRVIDGCEGAARGAWPGLDGYIEPGGHVSMVSLRVSQTAKKTVAKVRAR